MIDLDRYEAASVTREKAVFVKESSLTNYSGFVFDLRIEREISVLSSDEIAQELGLENVSELNSVGYKSKNTLTNTGIESWKKETGLLSIWLLGMFIPSDETTIVVPFIEGETSELGKIVNDTYFGKVPSDRLKIGNGVLFFKGDGKYRSKIGLLPTRAKEIAGSYDAGSKTLTIIKYNKPYGVTDYVNSLWEIQQEPYKGDVINSYNDGPPKPGEKPLGPFYELETSSPAFALGPNERGVHTQVTVHFEGDESLLSPIAKELLGVSLEEINHHGFDNL